MSHTTVTAPGAEEPVLRDVSFEARPGETTAIVGSTGSGKCRRGGMEQTHLLAEFAHLLSEEVRLMPFPCERDGGNGG